MQKILVAIVGISMATAAMAAVSRKAVCASECYVPDFAYPKAARSAGIEGSVEFTFLIGTDGRVVSCNLTAVSDPKLNDPSICGAVQRRWRYRPALADGIPVEETRTQRAGFSR